MTKAEGSYPRKAQQGLEMDIKDILDNFASRLAQIVIHQRTASDLRKNEFEKLRRISVLLESDTEIREQWIAAHNMGFTSAKDGEFLSFGSVALNVDEQKLSILKYQNKQYQWLLAEAFELFEDFIEDSYAFLGFCDNDSWDDDDAYGVSADMLGQKDYEWFRNRTKSRDFKQLNEILCVFRNRYSEIYEVERENHLGVNLRLVISLVEKLRHVIVHNGGVTSNKQKLIEIIISGAGFNIKCGIPKKGLNGDKFRRYTDRFSFIERHFGKEEYSNTVVLVESQCADIPFHCYSAYFTFLLTSLLSYAHLLYEQLSNLKYPK